MRTEGRPIHLRTEGRPIHLRTEGRPIHLRTEGRPIHLRPIHLRTEGVLLLENRRIAHYISEQKKANFTENRRKAHPA